MLAPWKTASQTLRASLAEYNQSPYDPFFHFNPLLGRTVHQHVTLGDLQSMPEGQLGYRICAFVRNPYDRAYSGFLQLQRDFRDQPRSNFEPAWVGDLVRAQIGENMSRIIAAGFDFDKWISILPEYEVFDSGRNTNMPLHPAHYWTHAEGRTADFVGRVETFEADFAAFCKLIGIETPPIELRNVSDGTFAEIGESRYAGKMSRRSLDRINTLFARDFELFGYVMI
jgi:hypothetical protein